MNEFAPSRAVVDLAAYAHNLDVVRQYLTPGRTGIMAVVKADAYGHGMLPIARTALASGAAMLGVSTIEEGLALRAADIGAPVLVLIQPCADALAAAVEHELTIMVSDLPSAERLGALGQEMRRVVPVHCKIDTGMGRGGFLAESAAADLERVARISYLDIQGVATHFPVAEQPDDAYTYGQILTFRRVIGELDVSGIPFEFAHAANSAAIVNYPDSHFDLVRPGLMSYGVWPTQTPPPHNPLRPVLRWETRVILVKSVASGASISYGRTYQTTAPMRAAILPVGYADGYRIALSNCGDVLIRGQRCPIRGRVCMDQVVVDVSGLETVQPGEPATLIGRDGAACITAEELAEKAGTIPYDILTAIGARVQRVYLPAPEAAPR